MARMLTEEELDNCEEWGPVEELEPSNYEGSLMEPFWEPQSPSAADLDAAVAEAEEAYDVTRGEFNDLRDAFLRLASSFSTHLYAAI